MWPPDPRPLPNVGDTVLAIVIQVERDGLLVGFDGPGEGFVPRSELREPSLHSLHSLYEPGLVLRLKVVSLDNVDQPIQMSEQLVDNSLGRDGVSPSGERSPYSHYTSGGTPKAGYTSRERAIEAARAKTDAPPLSVYECNTCGEWHLGRAN